MIGNQSVTRVRLGAVTGEDDYGNEIHADPVKTVINGMSLQPVFGVASTEVNGADFDRVVTRWRLFAPPGTDLVTTDRIQQGALDLEVDGELVTWPGANGQPHHLEVMLRKYGG